MESCTEILSLKNILFDKNSFRLKLIDWGLAEFYRPAIPYNNHVASKHFKAIELLLDYRYYDYSIDIWGFGVTLAMVILGRNPFAKSEKDFDVVCKIVNYLGYPDFQNYLEKYEIELSPELDAMIPRNAKRRNFKLLASKHTSPDAIDLIESCLKYDHQERITVEQALQHPYFEQIRKYKLPS